MVFRAGSIVRFEISNDYVAHRSDAARSWFAWAEIAAVPVAAAAMVSLTMAIAASARVSGCSSTSALPIAGASLAFLGAADLLFAPRRPWSRSRNNAAMNVTGIGTLFAVMLFTASAGWYGWPMLYPLVIFPLSLVVPLIIAFAPLRRLPIGSGHRGRLIAGCLIVGAALALLGHHSVQSQIACRWSGQ